MTEVLFDVEFEFEQELEKSRSLASSDPLEEVLDFDDGAVFITNWALKSEEITLDVGGSEGNGIADITVSKSFEGETEDSDTAVWDSGFLSEGTNEVEIKAVTNGVNYYLTESNQLSIEIDTDDSDAAVEWDQEDASFALRVVGRKVV